MKKIVCSVFALCCCSLVLAQEKTRSLSVELLGAQNMVGVNYDSRFKGNSGWGYGSNNIVVFLTIQYYCLPLRHE